MQTFRGTTKMTKKFDFTPNVFALLQQRRLLISLSIERRLLKIGFDSSEDSCHSIPLSLSLSLLLFLSIHLLLLHCLYTSSLSVPISIVCVRATLYLHLSIYFHFNVSIHLVCMYQSPLYVFMPLSIYQSTSTSMFPSI